MTTKVYYIENTNKLDKALITLEQKIPCFINRELIEMNYSKIEINARTEDLITVETILAPLV